MDKKQAIQKAKKAQQSGVIEALRDIGAQTTKTLTHDVFRSQNFIDNIIGNEIKSSNKNEFKPGQSISFSENRMPQETAQKAVSFERYLLNEERSMIEKKAQDLKLQLHVILNEVKNLSLSTQKLSSELKVASMQAPVESGIYHLVFFEKLMESIKSFRRKIDNANIWLQQVNKRAQKKNFWGMAKQKGTSFLMSAESYSQRNAG